MYLLNKRFLALLIILIGIGSIAIQHSLVPNPNVEWRLVIAKRLLEGQQIGKDIYEINTPLSNILYIPFVWVAQKTHLNSTLVMHSMTTIIGYIGIYIASLVLNYRGYTLFQNQTSINLFKLSFFSAFLFATDRAFSEREHFITLLLFPFALLIASPNGFKESFQEKKYSINGIVLFMAACATYIKPHYILSLLMMYGLVAFKKKNRLLTFEAGWLFGFILIGIMINFLCFPEYVKIFRQALLFYSGYNRNLFQVILFLMENTIVLFLLLILLYKDKQDKIKKHKELIYALSIMACANGITILLQQKDWDYIKLPLTIPLWGLIIFNVYELFKNKSKSIFLIMIFCTLFINYGVLSYLSYRVKEAIDSHQKLWVKHLEKKLKPFDRYVCISVDIYCSFPLGFKEHHYRYVSRYLDMWPTLGALSLAQQGKISNSQFESVIRSDTKNIIEDIQTHQPESIIFVWEKDPYNQLRYFSHHKEMLNVLQHYQLIDFFLDANYPGQATWVFLKKMPEY